MWKKLNLAGKVLVSLALSIVIILFLGQQIDMSSDLQTVLCIILTIVLVIVFNVSSSNSEAAIKEAMKDIVFKEEDGGLFVKEKNPAFSKALKIEADKMYTMEHEDAQYIYTSATVGGITTGGVTKIGDRDYIQTRDTGKYCLTYCDDYLVKRIRLDTSLWEAAKNSPISSYLNNNTKSIVVVYEVTPSQDIELLAKSDPNAAIKKMQSEMRNGYPSRKKCADIINWLSGIN